MQTMSFQARPVAGEQRISPRPATWQLEEIRKLFELPFNDLLFKAMTVHRQHFSPNEIQLSTLLSIKTGGCPEDCRYCPQSARHEHAVPAEPMLSTEAVVAAASAAKAAGASRFCMGAAWRSPKPRDLETVLEMVTAVKSLGLETCVTLGMLRDGQAERLRDAGLDYYNHNLDTGKSRYPDIVTTRKFEDRLDTLHKVRDAGIKVCCGGIVGMGESREQRLELIAELANLDPQPESVPINHLVKAEGTPLADSRPLEPVEFVRTIAVARITMPKSRIRLSAGREGLSDEAQALSFLAGANSIFYGERLLTTPNPEMDRDRIMMKKLGLIAGA